MKYIRNLHAKDDRIYNSSPQLAKHTRPYIGIIVTCNGQKYCIPLTSFKPKHENMSDRIDFSRIIINSKIRKHDTSEIAKRKQLYRQELQWCNENYDKIVNKANVLYNKYMSGEYFKRRHDCLNFAELEKICKHYNSQ